MKQLRPLKFSSEFPPVQFERLFENAYIRGGSFNGSMGRAQCRCEDGDHRAFFEFEYNNISESYDIVYFVIFEIKNGGQVWQISSYSLNLDGSLPSYVSFTVAKAVTASHKRIQSGSNSESDVLLWGTELPKLGIYPVIFDTETEKLFSQETDSSLLHSSRYCWVATNRKYHEPVDFSCGTIVENQLSKYRIQFNN